MPFRVLFWNIENFAGTDPGRLQKIADHITATQPDIVAFSEIRDKAALRSILFDALRDYDFGVTDGVERIELLAGWRRGVFEQAIYTQRREFKAGSTFLRPGALLSVRKSDRFYNFLFLHCDSGVEKRDYGNRQDMFEKVWKLQAKLVSIEDSDPSALRFVVMGDLNTMGRQARGQDPEITGDEEIVALRNDAERRSMSLPDKSHDVTWADVDSSGQIERSSDLDHAIVADGVALSDVDGSNAVLVRGWVDADTNQERLQFVETISDHASLEIVVEEVRRE